MSQRQTAVRGLLRPTSRLILHLINLSLLLVLTGIVVQAQSSAAVRVLRASYDADNNLIIQADVAANDMIVDAHLLIDDREIELLVELRPLQSEQWFILDAGESMLNAYGLIKDDLQPFVDKTNPLLQTGGIIFADEIILLEATDDLTRVQSWLDDYIALPNISGCVLDSLNQLPDLTDSPRKARRIMLITGDNADTCSEEITDVQSAIDVIFVGNPQNSFYSNIANQTGGLFYQSSVLGLSERLDALWRGSVLALSVPIDEAFDSAQVVINLASGQSITETIRPIGEFIIPPTATPLPTTTPLPPTATATDIPITDTAIPTETTIPRATATPTSEATEALIIVAATASPVPAVAEQSSGNANMRLIIGGGIAAAVVVLGAMLILLGVGRSRSNEQRDELSDTKQTSVFTTDAEYLLDMTEIVTIRQLAAQSGPTKVAELINEITGTRYEVHRPMSTLGRRRGSDILIEDDNQISREHLRFTTRDDGSILVARMTSNPILVNGVPMETTRLLNDGDVLQLSPTLNLTFKLIQAEEQES